MASTLKLQGLARNQARKFELSQTNVNAAGRARLVSVGGWKQFAGGGLQEFDEFGISGACGFGGLAFDR